MDSGQPTLSTPTCGGKVQTQTRTNIRDRGDEDDHVHASIRALRRGGNLSPVLQYKGSGDENIRALGVIIVLCFRRFG